MCFQSNYLNIEINQTNIEFNQKNYGDSIIPQRTHIICLNSHVCSCELPSCVCDRISPVLHPKNLVCFYTIIKRCVFNLNVTGIFLNSSSFNSFNYLLFFYFLRVCLSTVYRGVLSHSEEFGRKIYNDFEHEFISRTKLFPSGSVPIGAMTVKHRNNQNNKLKNKN